jgi:hypothetical protein
VALHLGCEARAILPAGHIHRSPFAHRGRANSGCDLGVTSGTAVAGGPRIGASVALGILVAVGRGLRVGLGGGGAAVGVTVGVGVGVGVRPSTVKAYAQLSFAM